MPTSKHQLKFLKSVKSAYGGELLKTRAGRSRGRPISTYHSMHLVIRSSKAKGEYSLSRFRKPIEEILHKFGVKHGVKLIDFANVGNHLHIHIKLAHRHGYKRFIRAVTASIAMKVTGKNRWTKTKFKGKFFDLRPFTRFVESFAGLTRLTNYISVNRFEGMGYSRDQAKYIESMIRQGQWVSLIS